MDTPPRTVHPQHARSASYGQGPPIAANLFTLYEEPSPPETIGSGHYTTDHLESPPSKRPRLSGPSVAGAGRGRLAGTTGATPPDAIPRAGAGKGTSAPAGKSKRVRTGCFTCRDRHLKCDEGLPDCLNCRKSNRDCIRGIRLNFVDVKVKSPRCIPRTAEWSVDFKDESRLIASEYEGGLETYAPYNQRSKRPSQDSDAGTAFRPLPSTNAPDPALPLDNGGGDNRRPQSHGMYFSAPQTAVQGEPANFEDSRGQPLDLMRRRSNESYGQHPPGIPPQTMQGASTGRGYPASSLPERYSTLDGTGPSHSYQTSKGANVTSSLIPIGTGPVPQSYNPALPPDQPADGQEGILTPPNERMMGHLEFLSDEEEIYYMQVFVNEVATWMDSFDHQKHFSRIVPYLALRSPMLLKAVLACGVKHLELTKANFDESKVHIYYDAASTMLYRSLQNPDRDMAECATTAAVLNVYEIMSESAKARMEHISGARALIRECGWNAKSIGIGAACFWLNIGMEVLSCLAFNWKTAWDPDQWGLDLGFLDPDTRPEGDWEGQRAAGTMGADDMAGRAWNPSSLDKSSYRYNVGGGGEEEAWVHRIFYIVAKIANFRANIPRFQERWPHDEQARLAARYLEWQKLKAMCDRWNDHCPRPMRPIGYVPRKSSKSLFPHVWLIRRAAIVGRLFYHTAMCLLAQINPLSPRDTDENRAAQLHHAHQACGIVAHTKDHGVASVAIRSLTIAGSVLTDPAEQKEVLEILDRINRDTGWRLGSVLTELKKAWAASRPDNNPAGGSGGGPAMLAPLVGQPPPQGQQQQGGGFALAPPAPIMPRPVHPLLAKADFSLPDHPYTDWYRKPNGPPSAATRGGLWCP